MTASHQCPQLGILFVSPVRIHTVIFAWAVQLFCSGSSCAAEVEIGKLLKARGAESTESRGFVTAVSVRDASQWSAADFRQFATLRHFKMLSLSNGLNDERLAQLASLETLEYLQTNLAQIMDDGIKPLARSKNLKCFHPGPCSPGLVWFT